MKSTSNSNSDTAPRGRPTCPHPRFNRVTARDDGRLTCQACGALTTKVRYRVERVIGKPPSNVAVGSTMVDEDAGPDREWTFVNMETGAFVGAIIGRRVVYPEVLIRG